MRISETGNSLKRIRSSSGYTLLEVMAVITLIGIVTLIVYPQFTISPERNEIVYIGKLLQADINLVSEEAFSVKKEISIYFNTNGYAFMIDETEITRNFTKYQFAFDIPAPEEIETAGGNPGVEPTAVPDASGAYDTGFEGSPEEQGEAQAGAEDETEPHQLRFTSNRKCNSYELNWQTIHFTGKLKVDQDGVVDWSYAQK